MLQLKAFVKYRNIELGRGWMLFLFFVVVGKFQQKTDFVLDIFTKPLSDVAALVLIFIFNKILFSYALIF